MERSQLHCVNNRYTFVSVLSLYLEKEMFTTISARLNILSVAIYKNLTLFLFFILPSKVANVFVSLSILALIYQIRRVDYRDNCIDGDKFKRLLRVSFNEEIMLLPSYTVNWFWKDDFLSKTLAIDGAHVTIRDAISRDEVLFKHLRLVTETLLENIPLSLKVKLRLSDAREKLAVKHNVMNLLIYG